MAGIIRIEGSDGLGVVKQGWKSAVEDRTTFLSLDTNALAMIVGIGSAILESLREEKIWVKISGIQRDEWMIRLIRLGSPDDSSSKQAYESLYSEICFRLSDGRVRMDEFGEGQNPLVLMFSQLPSAIQQEISRNSMSPENLKNNNPAF